MGLKVDEERLAKLMLSSTHRFLARCHTVLPLDEAVQNLEDVLHLPKRRN